MQRRRRRPGLVAIGLVALHATAYGVAFAGIYRVELNEYLSIQGILVATERRHYRLSKEKRPFVLPGKDPGPEWTEKLSGIRFLSNEEVDDLLDNNEPRAEED